MEQPSLLELVQQREQYIKAYDSLIIDSVKQINMKHHDLLTQDLGVSLGKSIAKDAAGEIVRHYFDTSDYYITVDQMYHRIIHFDYNNDPDVLKTNEGIRKDLYNVNDSEVRSETLQELKNFNKENQSKLFTINREKDSLDKKGKDQYRQSKKMNDGNIQDELTGREGEAKTVVRNGKEIQVSDLHVDHIQSREAATYNERYLSEQGVDQLRQFYNSDDNFQMLHASANTSKGDIRVYDEKGQDITYRATSEQLTDAIVQQWEKDTASGDKKAMLYDKGYLDESGNVKESVRKELESNIRHSQNKESMVQLKNTKYGQVATDAAKTTAKSIPKMLAGQLIYYAMPPVIYEVKQMVSEKQMTLDRFMQKLKAATGRISAYVIKNLRSMFDNIKDNVIKKFLKSFFDILISLVKATVQRIMKMVKSVVMSLVTCVKTLRDKTASKAQKADAITKILSATFTTIIIEVIMEYAEKQFGLPNWLMEPLQLILTIVATNVVMLILQKADLFHVKHGLLVQNIRNMFEEERSNLNAVALQLTEQFKSNTEQKIQVIQSEIEVIKLRLTTLDLYNEDVLPELERLNRMYKLNIDFYQEWRKFSMRVL